jgi:hypothetical protein
MMTPGWQPLGPRPRPKRFTHPKAMTIAIGTMYQQTMILAADSEVTIPDYMKGDKGKIHWTVSGTDMLAVTGAGEVAYLDAAFGEVMSLFHRKGDVWEFGDKLDAWLQKFYRTLPAS